MAQSEMQAVVYHAPGDLRIESVPRPRTGPHDVLLRVDRVGICGSDLHVYRTGQFGTGPGMIMGHEFSGTAVEVGSEVSEVSVGGRYTGFTIALCGTCYWCRSGNGRLCPELFGGYSGYGKPGGMAEYVRIESAVLGSNLIPVPDGVSDEAAALAEPLGTATYAIHRARPKDGDTVMVLGAGPVGLLLLQALKATADVQVIVTEVSESRARIASELGADHVLDARREDLLAAVQGLTGTGRWSFGAGGMADIVFDAAAVPATFEQALRFVRSQGTVCLVGVSESPSLVDSSLIVHKDVRVLGVFGSSIPHGMRLIADGGVDVSRLVSHRFPLSAAPEAFEVAAGAEALKVMLEPGGAA